MNRKYIVALLLAILYFLPVQAQFFRWRKKKIKEPVIDSTYIYQFPRNLSLEFNGKSNFHAIVIQNKESKEYLTYLPSVPVDIGLKFNYRWLGFSIGLAHFHKDPTIYGKSNNFNLSVNIYGRWMITDFAVRTYKGFYVYSPLYSERLKNYNIPYPHASGMKHFIFKLNMLYLFNSKTYSVKAAFTQNEIQKKSGGSFLTGYYMAFHNIRSGESPVPEADTSRFPGASRFNGLKDFITGFQAGYAHSFVIAKNINLSFLLNPVFGFQIYSLQEANNAIKHYKMEGILKWNYRLSLTYDIRKYYFGFMYVEDYDVVGKRKESLQDYYRIRSGFFKVYAGFRFFDLFQKNKNS